MSACAERRSCFCKSRAGIVMVNPIRFYERARYLAEYRQAHDDADGPGMEAYMRYAAV